MYVLNSKENLSNQFYFPIFSSSKPPGLDTIPLLQYLLNEIMRIYIYSFLNDFLVYFDLKTST